MNLNDAYAPVMAVEFSGAGDQPPFSVDVRNRENGLIYRTNPRTAPGGKQSSRLDFSRPDAANTRVLNKILWHERKGKMPMPAALAYGDSSRFQTTTSLLLRGGFSPADITGPERLQRSGHGRRPGVVKCCGACIGSLSSRYSIACRVFPAAIRLLTGKRRDLTCLMQLRQITPASVSASNS